MFEACLHDLLLLWARQQKHGRRTYAAGTVATATISTTAAPIVPAMSTNSDLSSEHPSLGPLEQADILELQCTVHFELTEQP